MSAPGDAAPVKQDDTKPAAAVTAAAAAAGGAVPEQVKAAERATASIPKKLNLQAAPIRQYLEATVVPVLMQGLQALCKERPENPVEYLAAYLLKHNPQAASKPSTAAPMDTSS